MHLSNPSSHFNTFDENNAYPKYENLKVSQLGVDIGYIFNSSQYSYSAAFEQNTRQLKSAGSFLIGGYFSFFRVNNNDKTLAPINATTNFVKLNDLKAFSISTVGIETAYGHNFILKRYGIIGLIGSAGIGMGSFVKKQSDEKNNALHVSGRFKIKFITGYHGKMHSGGFQFSLDALQTNYTNNVRATSLIGYTSIYYRFEFSTKREKN